MRILIAAVGKRPPDWAREAKAEYATRLPRQLKIDFALVTPVSRAGGQSTATAKRKEAERLRALVPEGARRIALDEHGRQLSTVELGARLQRWMQDGRDVVLLIGGADGLDRSLIDDADEIWSLSKLTLAHAMVPVIVSEQLYRAWSLISNHPYHRA